MNKKEIKQFLDEKVSQYNTVSFIESDPIQVPHQFGKKEDIEIASFLSASIAWGQRKTIIRNAFRIMELLDHAPHDFILNHEPEDLKVFNKFVHRTFNGADIKEFILSLKNIYQNHGGLEKVFTNGYCINQSVFSALSDFRKKFVGPEMLLRTQRHVSSVMKNSAAKRLNMFLMWMVRNDNNGVHFGLWKGIQMKDLMLPLDIHTGNVGRKLGLLNRKQNDWKAVEEITRTLREFDKNDPVKYDFALFGLGVFERF